MCDDRYRNNTQIVNRMLLLNGNSLLTYLWTLAPLLLFLKANTTFVFFISCCLIALQVTLDRHGIIGVQPVIVCVTCLERVLFA